MDAEVPRPEVRTSTREKDTAACTAEAATFACVTCERPGRPQTAEYAQCLGTALSRRKDLVLDMTSLKSCLDPAALPSAEPAEQAAEEDEEEKVMHY